MVLSELTVLAFWLNNVHNCIDLSADRDKMNVISVACCFCAEGRYSGGCVKV